MTSKTDKHETEGLQCLRCYSVLFDINGVIEHIIADPSHQYWKYGEGKGVVFIKVLKEVTKK